MSLGQLLINYNRKVLTFTFMRNIKSCQQYLLFYYSPNKMFLKIAPKPIRALINISDFPNKI